MYLTIIILPFLASIVSGLFGKKVGVNGSHLIACSSIIFTTIFAVIAFVEVGVSNIPVYISIFRWIDSESFNISWGFTFDTLTVSMLIPVLIVSSLVHVYSIGYMSHDPHNQRFFSYLSLFTFMMVILVTSNNFLVMFVGWKGEVVYLNAVDILAIILSFVIVLIPIFVLYLVGFWRELATLFGCLISFIFVPFGSNHILLKQFYSTSKITILFNRLGNWIIGIVISLCLFKCDFYNLILFSYLSANIKVWHLSFILIYVINILQIGTKSLPIILTSAVLISGLPGISLFFNNIQYSAFLFKNENSDKTKALLNSLPSHISKKLKGFKLIRIDFFVKLFTFLGYSFFLIVSVIKLSASLVYIFYEIYTNDLIFEYSNIRNGATSYFRYCNDFILYFFHFIGLDVSLPEKKEESLGWLSYVIDFFFFVFGFVIGSFFYSHTS